MNRTSTKLFIFAAGAAIGSAVAWLYAKKYYEQIANDEIESMKEWVARRVGGQEEPDDEKTPDPTANPVHPSAKPDLMAYASMAKDLGYYNYSRRNDEPKEPSNDVEEVDDQMDNGIYIIKPEVFGEEDGYEEVSLTYYADGVLCDEQDNVIEDADSMVGPDFADYFGYYEDDAVYVRNENLKTDYEILADSRNYANLYDTNSHSPEDE